MRLITSNLSDLPANLRLILIVHDSFCWYRIKETLIYIKVKEIIAIHCLKRPNFSKILFMFWQQHLTSTENVLRRSAESTPF